MERKDLFFPSPKLEFEDNLFTVHTGVENSNSLLYLTFLCIISQRKLHGRFFVAIIDLKKQKLKRNSLAVQWLGLCAFTAEVATSIPGQGTEIQHTQNK